MTKVAPACRASGSRFASWCSTPPKLTSTIASPFLPGTVVQVTSGVPPCDAVTGAEVVETSGRVVLTVWTGPQDGAQGCDLPQAAIGMIQWVRVKLAAPLGTRELVQGRQA